MVYDQREVCKSQKALNFECICMTTEPRFILLVVHVPQHQLSENENLCLLWRIRGESCYHSIVSIFHVRR